MSSAPVEPAREEWPTGSGGQEASRRLQLGLRLVVRKHIFLLLIVVGLVPFVLKSAVDNGIPIEVANTTEEVG